MTVTIMPVPMLLHCRRVGQAGLFLLVAAAFLAPFLLAERARPEDFVDGCVGWVRHRADLLRATFS